MATMPAKSRGLGRLSGLRGMGISTKALEESGIILPVIS